MEPGPGGTQRRGWIGDKPSRPSVCLFLSYLVRAALANHHEIFGGGQGHGQERLSPEPALSVKVWARKGREIQI